ncbi:hypothetical protein [Variovorax guangxiensis]|uniref:hypothetical protein n=1 Tax=Variovorax guangxiensis TaxID=1775474 RepID=UPI00285A40D5|nr:hypothetical protein [Variovorax guangxiensis]MDR6855300.1 FKBP-type peptidyl-prolyl cis-trans isomerase [Variovorax guangxiensis]
MRGMTNVHEPIARPSVSTAAEAVQHAEDALDGALFAGVDTTFARATLAAAREALAAEQAAAAQAESAAAAERAAAAQQAEAAAIDAAQEQIAEAIETIESAPGAERLPEPALPPMVALAAQQVARANAALARAQVPYREAVAARDALLARLKPKADELDAIRARRAAGDERPGDAATMHALGLDREDLDRLLAPLQAAVARAEPAAEQQAVAAAEAALQAARRRAEIDGMADRVRQLEAHFVEQVRRLRLAAAERNMSNLGTHYTPSNQLRMVAAGGWV